MSVYKMQGDIFDVTESGVKLLRNQVRYIRAESKQQAMALWTRGANTAKATILAIMANTSGQDIGSPTVYDRICSPTSGEYVTALESRGVKHTAAYTARRESWAFRNAERGKDKAIGKLMRIRIG